jgi:hypothetical protein
MTATRAPSTSAAPLRLDPRPRHVPWLLRQRLRFVPLLYPMIFGIPFMLGGALFLAETDLTDHDDDTVVGVARVVDVDFHKDSEGDVTRYAVTAVLPDGRRFTSHFENSRQWHQIGDSATAFGDAHPHHLRLESGHLRQKGAGLQVLFSVLVVLFVVVGTAQQVRKAKADIHLLCEGSEAQAHLVRHVKGDDGPDTLTFRFFDGVREREFSHTTSSTTSLTDEPYEAVLFDDDSAVLLDSLPGLPRVEDGHLVVRRPWLAVFGLVVPVIVVANLVAFVAALMQAVE